MRYFIILLILLTVVLSGCITPDQDISKPGETPDTKTSDIDTLLALTPGDPHLWYLKAQQLIEAGDLKEALDSLNRAVDISPENSTLIQLRAETLLSLGERERAIRDIHAVLDIDPGNQSAVALLESPHANRFCRIAG